MPERVNCHAKKRYQFDLRTPDASGNLATPAAGSVTGIKVRFSTTKTGAAIHADVGNLSALETSGKAARFYVELSKLLHEAHLLTLGVGTSYFLIPSKDNEFDMEVVEFIVADHHMY